MPISELSLQKFFDCMLKDKIVAFVIRAWEILKRFYYKIKEQFIKAKSYPTYKKVLFYISAFFIFLITLLLLININFLWLFGSSPWIGDLMNPKMNISSELYSEDGKLLGKYFVENRTPVKYEELNPFIIDALIATEDVRFYNHIGIDFRGTFAAISSTIQGDRRGGSTITQQLAKNLFKTRSDYSKGLLGYIPGVNVVIYKIKEWSTSLQIEMFYNKQEILTMYFNTVSFGSNTHGIKTAAATFFKKTPAELSKEDCALLVGMLKAPSTYSPVRHPKRATERRNVVFDQLEKYKFITTQQHDSLVSLPITLNFNTDENNDGNASYVRNAVNNYLREWLKENDIDLYSDGLKIYTTINSKMQKYAEEAMAKQMKMLQRRFYEHWQGKNPWADEKGVEIPNFIEEAAKQTSRYKTLAKHFDNNQDSIDRHMNMPRRMKVFTWNGEKDTTFSPMDSLRYYKKFLHAGLISMEPNDGYIRAWVGDINYEYFKFDHVKQSKRQPGSLFKAYVYAAAMDAGYGPCDQMTDQPVTVNYVENGEQKSWSPSNADCSFSFKTMTLKYAFAKSINSVAVQLTDKVSPKKVVEYAHKMGITTPLVEVPSVGLGSSDVSLYEIVNSYCTMANGGYKVEPILVTKIVNNKGEVIYEAKPEKVQALTPVTAFYMLELLKAGLTEYGATTQALFGYNLFRGNTMDYGGKTGTSSNQSDGWFIGVSPNLVSGCWVGAEARSIHFRTTATGEGCKTALPIYGYYMERVIRDDSFPQYRGRFPKVKLDIPKEYTCHTRYVPKDTLVVADSTKVDSLIVQ